MSSNFSPLKKEKPERAKCLRSLKPCAEVNFGQRTSCSTWAFAGLWVHGSLLSDCAACEMVAVLGGFQIHWKRKEMGEGNKGGRLEQLYKNTEIV